MSNAAAAMQKEIHQREAALLSCPQFIGRSAAGGFARSLDSGTLEARLIDATLTLQPIVGEGLRGAAG